MLDWFDVLVQVAGVILAIVGGFGAVPIVNWLKGVLKLQGSYAIILTVVFSAIWGIAELLVGGQITQDAITVSNLAALVATVFAVSQAKYNSIKNS